ncbi:hypothetical protein B5F07_18975 [Lachnoclostridium sp. An169]|nr:hypothetical protein B5F07_18975 [Lachnoclostridium sp. An169]
MEKRTIETKEMKNRKLKQHIFDVALKLMKEIGFDNITIRMICQEAGISTGMFYQHFSNKEDLLAYYYDEAQERFDDVVNEKLAGKEIREQLIEFYTWLFEFTSDLGVDFCRNFFSSKNKVMNTNLFHNRIIDITNRAMEDAIAGGFQLSPGRAPYQVSKFLCVMAKGVIFDWSAHEGSYDMTEFGKQLITLTIDGLL